MRMADGLWLTHLQQVHLDPQANCQLWWSRAQLEVRGKDQEE